MFTVSGRDCGCVSDNVTTDTTSESCSGWTANGQTCSFQVVTISQDCGLTSDPMNITLLLNRKYWLCVILLSNFFITLAVPSTTTNLTIRPVFTRNGSVQYVNVEFTGVVSNVM